MEHFASEGTFWLPDRPDRQLPGTLTFDPDGVALRLYDSLHAVESVEGPTLILGDPITVPVVHGHLRQGKPVTLLRSTGLNLAGAHRPQETWRAEFALTGALVTDDLFGQAMFSFDALMAWARPEGIQEDDQDPNIVRVDRRRTTLFQTATDDGLDVRLTSGAVGSWSHSAVHLDQWCQFEVSGEPLTIRQVLSEWVDPLESLLIVLLGRPVRLTSLYVRPPGSGPRDDALKVVFTAVQPAPKTPPTELELLSYKAPTLFTRLDSPIPTEELLRNWFAANARGEFQEAVGQLCSPLKAPFMFVEHRYASTFQAAEVLARDLLPTRDKPRSEHQERIDAITTALNEADIDEDDVRWATAILRGRNDRPLRRLIADLTVSTGAVGQKIMERAPGFSQEVARTRTGVSHGGAGKTSALRQHWLGELLFWVVRTRILTEAGVPLDQLASLTLAKRRFQDVLREVADS